MAVDGGRVVSSHPPYLPVTLIIHGLPGPLAIEALIDTGFDGDVVLPPAAITEATGPATSLVWRLADGTAVRASAYSGELRIGGTSVAPVAVTALGDQPLIGRGVTEKFTVTFDHDRQVIVEP